MRLKYIFQYAMFFKYRTVNLQASLATFTAHLQILFLTLVLCNARTCCSPSKNANMLPLDFAMHPEAPINFILQHRILYFRSTSASRAYNSIANLCRTLSPNR